MRAANARARRPAAAALAALAWALAAPAAGAGSPALRGAEWLASQQRSDGSFADHEEADTTAEVLVALAAGAAGGEAAERALARVERLGPARATRGTYAGRIVLGIVAAGADPRRLGGVDYAARLRSFYDDRTGAYDGSTLYGNAIALLGVVASGPPPPERAITFVRANQCADGGFGWQPGCVSGADTDTTAINVAALAAAGLDPDDVTMSRARSFLLSVQSSDGGFPHTAGGPANANSTGLVLSALAALAEHPGRAPWRQADGDDPLRALLALQDASGGFRWTAGRRAPDVYATVQAIPGVAGRALPVRGARRITPRPGSTAAGAPASPSPSGSASASGAVLVPISPATPAAAVAAPSAPQEAPPPFVVPRLASGPPSLPPGRSPAAAWTAAAVIAALAVAHAVRLVRGR